MRTAPNRAGGNRHRKRIELVGLCAVALSVACSRLTTTHDETWRAGNTPQQQRLHVLMINGGGSPPINYQSHLIHVQQLVELLHTSGVASTRIAVFAADGSDPGPDLAIREPQPEADFWRLRGTPLEGTLRTQVGFTDSAVADTTLHAATKAELTQWFDTARRSVRPGDTLLIYVTDHGTKNPQDPNNNFITLWGPDQSLSVHELSAMIETLDPRVRVVTLMSQCFSGSFAQLMETRAKGGVPSGSVCGYFSSTADRPAYGCYPENRGRENVGHSFHFLEALAVSGSFAEAHNRVLVTDATPDVPLRTSDVYLEELLQGAAAKQNQEFAPFVDALLQQAWQDKAKWEPEIRLLDRIGAAYGCFSARSLAELEDQTRTLPDIGKQFKTVQGAWAQTGADANQAVITRFLAENPSWLDRLPDPATQVVDRGTTRALAPALLHELHSFTAADPETEERITTVHNKYEAAAAASYRMEVRLAVALRMSTILTSIAGRTYIATAASPDERAAYETLRACEDLRLPTNSSERSLLVQAEPFPPFDDDVRQATEGLPAWMGIRFRDPTVQQRVKLGLKEGAAVVLTVYPDSPAAKAGLQSADIIVGPSGHAFTEPRQIRAWTMLSAIGTPQPLDVLRDGAQRRLKIVPAAYPLQWPQLPGPPKVGSAAPPLKVGAYRGDLPKLASGTPHLLFFWATWCLPCKAAIPEVLAFERDRHVPVLAITDEPPERLDAFFKVTGDFPENVAVDEYRRAFVAYGVSGTPTFVLVDGEGNVRSFTTGYSMSKGLGIDGWKWATVERQGGDG